MAEAMEPPAKRARLAGPSEAAPRDDGESDGDDELDLLASEPQAALDENDPDYILERQRAMAGNRFQQTMADIFAKYSRDFTDIGDEIDLDTGHVVVDNGHLANMRYEGDIGIQDDVVREWEEDDGVLLEDLVDSDEDVELEEADAAGVWHDPHLAELQEDEFPTHVAEAPSRPASVTSTPHTGDVDQLPFPSAGNVFMGFDSASNDSSVPPINLRPWDFLGSVDDATWDSLPEPNPASRAVRSKPKPRPVTRVPGYDGRKSIWAPQRGFKDEWWPRPPSKASSPSRAQGKVKKTADNESALNDPPKRPRGRPKGSKSRLKKSTASGKARSTSGRANGDRARIRNRTSTIFQRPYRRPPKLVPSVGDDADRRRSGRNRKPVDFLGKISWREVLGLDIPDSLGPDQHPEGQGLLDDDQGSVDLGHTGRSLPTPPESGHDTSDNEQQPVPQSSRAETIPDSQDTMHSKLSTPARRTLKTQARVRYSTGNASCVLSDDEEPVLFKKARRLDAIPPLQAVPAPTSSGSKAAVPRPVRKRTESTTKKTARPSKSLSTAGSSLALAGKSSGPVDGTAEKMEAPRPAKKRPRRSRGMLLPDGTHRKRGRPRKSAPLPVLPAVAGDGPPAGDHNATTQGNVLVSTPDRGTNSTPHETGGGDRSDAREAGSIPGTSVPNQPAQPLREIKDSQETETETVGGPSPVKPREPVATVGKSPLRGEVARKEADRQAPATPTRTEAVHEAPLRDKETRRKGDQQPPATTTRTEAVKESPPRETGSRNKGDRQPPATTTLAKVVHEAPLRETGAHNKGDRQPSATAARTKAVNEAPVRETGARKMGDRQAPATTTRTEAAHEASLRDKETRRKGDRQASATTTRTDAVHEVPPRETGARKMGDWQPPAATTRTEAAHEAPLRDKETRKMGDRQPYAMTGRTKAVKEAPLREAGARKMGDWQPPATTTRTEAVKEAPPRETDSRNKGDRQPPSTATRVESAPKRPEVDADAAADELGGAYNHPSPIKPRAPGKKHEAPGDSSTKGSSSSPSRTQRPHPANHPRPKHTPADPAATNPAHTPRETAAAPTSNSPSSSRRSLLSLIPTGRRVKKAKRISIGRADDDDELLGTEEDAVTLPKLLASPARKTWRASALTTEVYHTPVKKRRRIDTGSPDSVVGTPGGTKRTCGVDGYRCGRDFCFSCL